MYAAKPANMTTIGIPKNLFRPEKAKRVVRRKPPEKRLKERLKRPRRRAIVNV